jgi:DNA-binding winged helix-turn-helix (wHTH) protein
MEDTVRTHMRSLRRKIDSPDRASIITTVRGLGYKVSNQQEALRQALTIPQLLLPVEYIQNLEQKHEYAVGAAV